MVLVEMSLEIRTPRICCLPAASMTGTVFRAEVCRGIHERSGIKLDWRFIAPPWIRPPASGSGDGLFRLGSGDPDEHSRISGSRQLDHLRESPRASAPRNHGPCRGMAAKTIERGNGLVTAWVSGSSACASE